LSDGAAQTCRLSKQHERNNFLTLVWKIKKICHKIEHAIPKNPMFLFFDFVTFWRENDMPTLAPKN
jgi:hypothetical protein